MNQIVELTFNLLEKYTLANDEVSGFKFFTSQKFKLERKKFYDDLQEQIHFELPQNKRQSIKNLPQLIRYLIKNKSTPYKKLLI